MKKIFLAAIAVCLYAGAFAQETKEEKINRMLKDGGEYVKEKKYKEAAASLQEGINIINEILGAQILTGLPISAAGLNCDAANDQVTSLGTLMGAGMQVSRQYYNEDGKSISLTLQPNSPQLSSLNMFLDNKDDYPEGEVGKRVVVKEHKALLRFNTSADGEEAATGIAYMSMPFYTSVLTFQGNGFKTEKEFLTFAESLDYDKLAVAMGFAKKE